MPLNATEKKRKRQEQAAVEAIARAARLASEDGGVTSERGRQAEEELRSLSVFPTVVVLDLDDTLWVGDIDLTSGPPFKQDGRGLPVVAQKGGHGDKVVPFPDVPEVVDWLELQGIKVAICTHAWKPAWVAEVFSLLETASGTKYVNLLAHPIGNEVCKKTKDVHLRELSVKLGCPCEEMVFFDDKAHNVSDGKKAGATSYLTDGGLTWDAFVQCFRQFEQKKTGQAPESPVFTPAMSTPAMPKQAAFRPAVPLVTQRPRWPAASQMGSMAAQQNAWMWTQANQFAGGYGTAPHLGAMFNQAAWGAHGKGTGSSWMAARPNRTSYGRGPY